MVIQRLSRWRCCSNGSESRVILNMSLSLSTSACAKHKSDDHKGQLPQSGYQFLCFTLDTVEELPRVQTFLEDAARKRRKARPGYAPSSMLRLVCMKFLLNERYNVQLLERLRTSPTLLKLCGLESLPSQSTVSRFFGHISEHVELIEDAKINMVNLLRERRPDTGEIVSIDSTDIEAYANPNRNPVIDEDAEWGVRTPKNRSNAKDVETFFGYKLHLLSDAVHDIPLSYSLLPANHNDSPQLPPLVHKAQQTYDWLKPEYMLADRGYDALSNHAFLVKLDIRPVIHIRKPSNATLHGGLYETMGAPVCLGGMTMSFVRTDPETGKHLYQCPTEGCQKFQKGEGKSIFSRCDDSHWEDPKDNLRVIGVVPRRSQLWRDMYRKRQGIERFFGSAKRSRLLDKHQYVLEKKLRTHVALAMLTYLSTMFARICADDSEHMRHMRIKV